MSEKFDIIRWEESSGHYFKILHENGRLAQHNRGLSGDIEKAVGGPYKTAKKRDKKVKLVFGWIYDDTRQWEKDKRIKWDTTTVETVSCPDDLS